MNLKKIKEIIQSYKKHFGAIHKEEIYKWRAVKHFQDNWNIDAKVFPEMIENSLAYTYNLMDSGNYFPKRMMLHYVRMDSEAVRNLFLELYRKDEDKSIEDKWLEFKTETRRLNKEFFRSKNKTEENSYQDQRAFMVYLALRFPERYFLFKFGMFKEFVEKIDFPYTPIKGRVENLTSYTELCGQLREEIIKDEELLKLHNGRLKENHYIEKSFNLLTQDVIYATIKHLDRFESTENEKPVFQRLIRVDKILNPNSLRSTGKTAKTKIDFAEKQRINKKIGDLGEELVFEYEREKLKKIGSKKEPQYIAHTDDSQGFDILSFDENDEEIYIEVKTTKGSHEAEFFITANELRKSIETKEKYRLYRVYEYNEEKNTGKFTEKTGSLESLCINPALYKISYEKDDSKPV